MSRFRFVAGLFAVLVSMAILFLVPPNLFVAVTFGATTCMIAASAAVGSYRLLFRPSPKSVVTGLGIAALLYVVFIAGNAGINAVHPFGISSSNESSIYSLIASPRNPWYLQMSVLVFDAVGYESYFRGTLQRKLAARMGGSAPVATAALDAAVHLVSLNPLWVASTFVVDTFWGFGYRYTRDLAGNVVSHFAWDTLIFVLLPIH